MAESGCLRDGAFQNVATVGAVSHSNSSQTGALIRRVAVGFAPTEFAETAAAGIVNLNTVSGLAAAAGTALKIPAGALIERVMATNNGTAIVGGTDFDIGVHGTTGTTSNTMFDAVTLADLNTGAGRSVGDAVTGTAVLAADNFVTVTVNTTNNTAGDLKVVIEYSIMQ